MNIPDIEEAIDHLCIFDDFCKGLECFPSYRASLAFATSALERLIPTKPIIKPSKYTDVVQQYYCPNCGRYLGQASIHNVSLFNKERFCQGEGCGQAIDWETEA